MRLHLRVMRYVRPSIRSAMRNKWCATTAPSSIIITTQAPSSLRYRPPPQPLLHPPLIDFTFRLIEGQRELPFVFFQVSSTENASLAAGP